MPAAQSSSAVASPQPDGSEEPLPSKRTRKTSPSTVQVTYVMPGVSVFVLTHVPENSDGESERRASAPILSSRSCALRCFTSKLRKPDDCSIGAFGGGVAAMSKDDVSL